MVVSRCDYSPGAIIDGRYRVEKCLGEGAFGKVFKVSNAGNVYALKLLKLWEVDPEIREQLVARFDMEFHTGRIESDFLVHSYSYGMTEGNPYIVMEFCPNGDLLSLDGQNTDWVSITRQVLYGLKALHGSGKVHRDLKPENVLIKSTGMVALTDFGISGDRNKRMTERNILGKPTQIFGTYAYMPPEQVKPGRGDATVLPTTDLFSLGVMMYYLITKRLPFGPLENHSDLVYYQKNGAEGKWLEQPLRSTSVGEVLYPFIKTALVPDFKKRVQSVDEALQFLPQGNDNFHISLHRQKSSGSGYCLRVMHGDCWGQVFQLPMPDYHHSDAGQNLKMVTIGREDPSVRNVISIVEEKSSYMSRRHCTMCYLPSDKKWVIHDGQPTANSYDGSTYFSPSLNGTFVGSHSVGNNWFYLSDGDIISIGDTKLRFEEN